METLNVRDDAGIRFVMFDRPDALNAMNNRMMDELADVFLDAAASDDARVLVLSGNGRAFCAGADLMEMGRSDYEPRHGLDGMLRAIVDFEKPFLLAINGVGVGIGATIAGLADVTLIAESARLRCPFSALGLTAEAGSTFAFPLLLGKQRASWFLLASEWMTAEECVSAGLALESVADADLLEAVTARARTLCELPQASLVATKRLIGAPFKEQLLASIAAENAALDALVGKPANREALIALFGPDHGMRQMRKWCSWYTVGFRGSAKVRGRLVKVSDLEEMNEAFKELDFEEEFPASALRAHRGKGGRTQSVRLPDGYLEDREDDTPPKGPHTPDEIAAWEKALSGG